MCIRDSLYTAFGKWRFSKIFQRSFKDPWKIFIFKDLLQSLQVFKGPWRSSKIVWGFSPGFLYEVEINVFFIPKISCFLFARSWPLKVVCFPQVNHQLGNDLRSLQIYWTNFNTLRLTVEPVMEQLQNARPTLFTLGSILWRTSHNTIFDPSRENGAYTNLTLWLFSQSWPWNC